MIGMLSPEALQTISKGYDTEPGRSFSISTECYRNPEFLKIEQRQIFHKSWQFLCHEEKLHQPGSYLAADIQGQNIVVIRDTNGELPQQEA